MPSPEIRQLRAYERQREMLVRYAAAHVQHMQKALELMNCKLPEVVSDIVGATGMLIIKAIVRGTRDPLRLAKYRHENCKASEAAIAAALQGTWQEEYVFELRQALKLYEEYHRRLSDCEAQIEACLQKFPDKSEGKALAPKPRKRSKAKNAVRFDGRTLLLKMAGVDVTVLEGIDETTGLVLLSELGSDLSPFPTQGHFTSWLGLCPNHRGSGGKIKKRQVKRSASRANQAFRMAASGCHHAKNAMGAFYRRIAAQRRCQGGGGDGPEDRGAVLPVADEGGRLRASGHGPLRADVSHQAHEEPDAACSRVGLSPGADHTVDQLIFNRSRASIGARPCCK